MFVVYSLLIVTLIYLLSAVVFECVFISFDKYHLPVIGRIGLGYVLSYFYFSLAWKCIPMPWVWLTFGFVLLLSVLSRKAFNLGSLVALLKLRTKPYLITYIWIFLLANVFFLPNHISGCYGPFSEAGGDVTVYAHGAKYFFDHDFPVYGIKNLLTIAKEITSTPLDQPIQDLLRSESFDPQKGNPPAADSTGYLLWIVARYPSFQFAPTGMWSGLTGSTNYPAFFGTLGFLYSGIILFMWSLFRIWGRKPAALGALLALSSLGLVSVPYNCYLIQTECLFIFGLMVHLVIKVRISSFDGLLAYLPLCCIVMASYTHYIAVLFPLLLLAATQPRIYQNIFIDSRRYLMNSAIRKAIPKIWLLIISIFFLFPLVVDILVTSRGMVSIVLNAIKHIRGAHASQNVYFGIPKQLFSAQNFEMITGFISQQHFPPFVAPHPFLDILGTIFVFFTLGLSILGGCLWWPTLRRAQDDSAWKPFLLYLACGASVSLSILMTQQSLYTQAKGSQNTILAFYIFFLMPFVVTNSTAKYSRKFLNITILLLFICFFIPLLFARITFLDRLAYGLDRSAILGPDYIRESLRILQSDENPFVLIEPRKSVDTYFSNQPFFGSRCIPTKDLILQYYFKPEQGKYLGHKEERISSEFITENDVSHLWILAPYRLSDGQSIFNGPYHRYEWYAFKLIESKIPRILLFGSYYEYFYSRFEHLEPNSEIVNFSYLRNGTVMLFIPPGEDFSASFVIKPRGNTTLEDIAQELAAQAKHRDGMSIDAHAQYLKVTIFYSKTNAPQFVPVFKCSKECMFGPLM